MARFVSASDLSGPVPDVDSILKRALERSRWYEQERIETSYAFQLDRVSEKLDRRGEVSEREHLTYAVEPWDGGLPLERLIRKNGRELTASEKVEEEKRLAELRKDLRDHRKRVERRQERVLFDERLVSKYVFTFEERELLGGRRTLRVAFRPRGDDLPVETRMDRALNKAEGWIWVDEETAEIARVQFQLKEKIPIWWGLLGHISAVKGSIERAEVEPGIWMPQRFELYLNGRILFTSLHRQERIAWSGFRRAAEANLGAPPEPAGGLE
ncbi:MAG: hypothetical protein Kow001_18890 [Acidobacteriota bacterium]